MPGRVALVVGLAVAGLLLLAWWPVPSLPLTGADTWPILAQADRLAQRPLATVFEPYLDGLWDGARFWRPLLTLFAAIEWQVFGNTATGYHLLRLLILAASALLAGILAARGCRGQTLPAAAAGGLAAVVIVLHPVQLASVPVIARDADGLSALAILAALLLLFPREKAGPLRLAAGVLAALAAGLIKETGLAAPIIASILLFAGARRPWKSPRLRGAGLALTAGLAALLLTRFAILGTIGGYLRVVRPVPLTERALLLGRGLLGAGTSPWLPLIGGLLLTAAAVLGVVALRSSEPPLRALHLACAAWVLLGAVGALSSPRMSPRYAEALLPPLAILCGSLGAGLLAARRHGRGRTAVAAGGALALGVALLLVPGSPLADRSARWRSAGVLAERVLLGARDCWEEMERERGPASARVGEIGITGEPLVGGGGTLTIDPFPYQPRSAASGPHGPAMALMPYSVRAYLLLHGARRPVVIRPGRPLHAEGRGRESDAQRDRKIGEP